MAERPSTAMRVAVAHLLISKTIQMTIFKNFSITFSSTGRNSGTKQRSGNHGGHDIWISGF